MRHVIARILGGLLAAALSATMFVSLALGQAVDPTPRGFRVLPAENAVRAYVQIKPGGYWLGLHCREADELLRTHLRIDGGLVVMHVVPGGPAASAGVERNDILLAIGDERPGNVVQLSEAVQKSKGKRVAVQLLHNGEKKTVEVTPNKRSATPAVDFTARTPESLQDFRAEFEKALPGHDWQKAFGGRFILPGIVVTGVTIPNKGSFPKDLRVNVRKEGDKPAKITVQQGDKKWEVTEDQLDQLPKDVRPYVERVLGRGGINRRFSWNVEIPKKTDGHGKDGDAPPFDVIRMPRFRSERIIRRSVKETEKSPLDKQLKEMNRKLDNIQRQLNELHRGPGPRLPKPDGAGAKLEKLRSLDVEIEFRRRKVEQPRAPEKN